MAYHLSRQASVMHGIDEGSHMQCGVDENARLGMWEMIETPPLCLPIPCNRERTHVVDHGILERQRNNTAHSISLSFDSGNTLSVETTTKPTRAESRIENRTLKTASPNDRKTNRLRDYLTLAGSRNNGFLVGHQLAHRPRSQRRGHGMHSSSSCCCCCYIVIAIIPRCRIESVGCEPTITATQPSS